MGNMLYVTLLFTILLVPYTNVFQKLVTFNGSHVTCTDGFRSIGETFYSTFLVMLHMFDFRTLDIPNHYLVYIMHVIFTVILNFVMLNYFIAVLAEATTYMGTYRDQLFQLVAVGYSETEHMCHPGEAAWITVWLAYCTLPKVQQ